MESLAVILEPYKDVIASTAATVTYFHQLSGAVVCNTIRKQKSTVGQSVMPFLAGTIISVMAFRFGSIINDAPTIQVNLIGTALNIAYICFFFWYTNNVKDKMLAWSQIGYGGAFVAAIFAYTFVENPNDLAFRYGMIFTAVLFFFIGMPFLSLGEIIRNKSTEGLPFPIILSGTAISFLWFLYGVVTRESFAIVQNGIIFLMSVIQLSLFAIYPSKPAGKSKKGGIPLKSANNNNNKKKN